MNPPNGGDDERKSVEVTARTVDEAVARGLVRLGGLSRNEVNIEILKEPKSGLLGFGTAEATVRLTTLLPGEEPSGPVRTEKAETAPEPKAEAPAAAEPRREARRVEREPAAEYEDDEEDEESEERRGGGDAMDPGDAEAEAMDVVRTLLGHLGYGDATVRRTSDWLPDELEDDRSLVLTVQGGQASRLLERGGEPLEALQFIARLMLARRLSGWVNLLVDIEGDRARRVQELVQLANQSAELVDREGRPVSLPPMTPYERRVVHLILQDHPMVTTQSIGKGETRKVTVRRKDQVLPELD